MDTLQTQAHTQSQSIKAKGLLKSFVEEIYGEIEPEAEAVIGRMVDKLLHGQAESVPQEILVLPSGYVDYLELQEKKLLSALNQILKELNGIIANNPKILSDYPEISYLMASESTSTLLDFLANRLAALEQNR